MSILYIGLPKKPSAWLQRIYSDFASELGDSLPHRIYDLDRSPHGQFTEITAVVEAGGSFATSAIIDEAAAQGVTFWQVIGTGMDHVDVPGFARHGILLANLPGLFSSIALAEHALFCMLFFAKHYSECQKALQSHMLCDPVNEELNGKTLGVLGYGASGEQLVRRASALGLRTIVVDIASPDPDRLVGIANVKFLGGVESLDQLVSEAHYLSIHVPLNDSTRHLMDGRALRLMKPTAVLINVARSEIVEESALIEALEQRRIRGAALDVFPSEPVDPGHPLLRMPNVLATPHIAGVTGETSRRRIEAAVANVRRVLGGAEPKYLVSKST